MSENMTDAEWLRFIANDFGEIFSGTERERFDTIAARLEQLERDRDRYKAEYKAVCDILDPDGNTILDGDLIHTVKAMKRENAALACPALGPNPTARDLMIHALRQYGYDGLYQHTDGAEGLCKHFTLSCRAGYIQPDGSVGPEKEGTDGH